MLVPENDSLIIEAGCIIYTNPNYWIRTLHDAYITAEGTETDSIIFTHNPNQPIVGWGGIYLGHAPENTSVFKYCTIENASRVEGGNVYQGSGIHGFDTNILIENSVIQNNRTSHFAGGGIGISALECKLVLLNSTIRNNEDVFTPPGGGGGIRIYDPNPGSVIKNCIIYGNGLVGGGGGIDFTFAENNIVFKNNVVYNNYAFDGGGIAVFFNSNPIIKNSIIWGNSVYPGHPLEFRQIYVYASDFEIVSSIINEEHCLFYNTFEIYGQSTPAGYGCDYPNYDFMNTDPMFVDGENGDFRLLPQSPAINAGTGELDPDGSPPDIGAIYFHLTKGDVNFDGNVTVSDIILLVNYILTQHTLWESQSWSMDTNNDSNLNVLDLILIVNTILEG
ncbi:MAG: right-handed parallel beta-helix repeat-containing protein [Candidatus Marinimicrobia bacterium]|nr:right-handed parallel beta-helix repeat-containing protein [Candidatus Neomarinimicrobiota bacterium]